MDLLCSLCAPQVYWGERSDHSLYCQGLGGSFHQGQLLDHSLYQFLSFSLSPRLQLRNTIAVSKTTIADFKKGIQLTKQLKLAREVQFTPQLMGDFLVGDNYVRPLAHVRYVVCCSQPMVT